MTKDGFVIVRGKRVNAAALLAALYNNTRAIGMGTLHDVGRLRREDARFILDARGGRFEFDYLYGRPIKVFATDSGEIPDHAIALYERDAGPGAFDLAVIDATGSNP